MSTSYDKPFRDYASMLQLMASRNLEINDPVFATNTLRSLSYYNLVNKSKLPCLVIPGTDMYVPGTTFEQLYTIHNIDSDIESVVLKYTLYIESALKSNLSYVVSQNYGVFTDLNDPTNSNPADYLCRSNYSKRSPKRNNTLHRLKSVMTSAGPYPYKSSSLAHYLQNHNHVPAWILVTSIALGDTIMWYDILVPRDKQYVCSAVIPDTSVALSDRLEHLKKSILLLREFRNLIAHGNRTISSCSQPQIPVAQSVALSHGLVTRADYSASPSARGGLHAALVALYTLIPDTHVRSMFVRDVHHALDPYSSLEIHGMSLYSLLGLPDNILARLEALK